MFILLLQVGTPHPTPDYDEVARILRQRDHIVWVGTPDEDGHLIFNDGQDCVASLAMPTNSSHGHGFLSRSHRAGSAWQNWRFVQGLRTLIRREQPDIVHVNQAKLPFPWLFSFGLRGHTHFIIDWRQIAEREFSRPFARLRSALNLQKRRNLSRYFFTHATFLHQAGAERILGSDWQKYASVVPLAVSAGFLAKENLPGMAQEQDSPVKFIYIGSLSRVRRLERLLLAAHKVRLEMNGSRTFQLIFVGPDKSEGYYQRLSHRLGLDDIVEINPPVPYERVPDLLLAADVALAYVPETPLDWHYHPTLKVLEYRAIGIPIIATDFQPNRVVVENGKNGLLVSNTVESLADAMQRFTGDSHFRQQSTLHAQAMRQGRLWADVTLAYEELYCSLIEAES